MPETIKDIVQHVKDNVDIVQVISKYVSLNLKGDKYWGLSPFKTEKTPSFTVNPQKNFYYCFSTAQGGDVFKFVQEVEHVDFMGAVRILARDMGIDIDTISHTQFPHNDKKEKVFEICKRIGSTFSYLLYQTQGAHALSYMHTRGYNDEILRKFNIGYSLNDSKWLYNFLQQKGYKTEELSECGLFSKNYQQYSLFKDRVMFPIYTISGQIVAFGGRYIALKQNQEPLNSISLTSGMDTNKKDIPPTPKVPKYINSPESLLYKKKKMLYGLFQCLETKGFMKHKKAYVVEGYLDVIAMHMAGYNSAVAPLGTAFTKEQATILRRATDSLVLLFDNDEAGLQACAKSAMIAEELEFKSVKVVQLSEKDPADVVETFGVEELAEQLLAEHDFFDYYLNTILNMTGEELQEKESSIIRILEYVNKVQSEYRKSEYIAKIADIFSTKEDIVWRLLQKNQQSWNVGDRYQLKNEGGSSATPSAKRGNFQEKWRDAQSQESNHFSSTRGVEKNGELLTLVALCGLILEDQLYFKKFRLHVNAHDLNDKYARVIFLVLEDLYRKNSLEYHKIFEQLPHELSNSIQNLIASGEASLNAKEMVDDYIQNIKLTRLLKRSKEIERLLRLENNHTRKTTQKKFNKSQETEAKFQEDKEKKKRELLEEKQFINKEIRRIRNT